MSNNEQLEIKKYVEDLKVHEYATPEEFHAAVKGAYMDRTRQVYFIWKKLKELYPEVDANRVIREGSWDFGLWQGNQIVKKLGTDEVGPKEVLLGQTSRGGWLVFQQEILELNDHKAVKMFHACPHAEALKELDVSAGDIKMFCRDMLGACDYAICDPFKNIKIEFPTTVADGEGHGCAMTIITKKSENPGRLTTR